MLKRISLAVLTVLVFAICAAAQEVEVDRYNIHAKIDAAASVVDVRATLSISNLAQTPKPKLFLQLTKLAKVSAVTVNGASATFDTVADRRVTTLNQIGITPQSSIEGGAKATVEVSYRIEAPESTSPIHVYAGEVLLPPAAIWVPLPPPMFPVSGPSPSPFPSSSFRKGIYCSR